MKVLFIAVVASFSIGIWFGINIGQGNALYENPFTDIGTFYDAHESAEDAGLLEQGSDFIEDQKEALQEQAKEKLEEMSDNL